MKFTDEAIEHLARLVHKAYCVEYERQKGEPYWTKGDYDLLDEDTKEYDRVTVRAIVEATEIDWDSAYPLRNVSPECKIVL